MQLDGVAVRYGSRQPWVVRDVTMTIRPGRLVRLDGVNGSGKSTLLRVIAGAAIPTAGKITGRPVTGYVPERFPPALPFSAREYLTHLGGMYRIKGAALLRRIDECLARLGASEHADMPFRNLSQGMCQKAAVAQALLPGPGLLVLDEAWTGLDAAAREALDAVVGERLAEGGAVIFVDHDPGRLAGLPQHRLELSGGRVRQVSSPPAGHDEPVAAPGGAEAAAGTAGALAGEGIAEDAPATGTGTPEGAGLAADRAVIIEVSGYPGAAAPGRIPGVLSARQESDLLTVRAALADSDAVLRALLAAADTVHVRSVRPAGRS